VSAITMTTSPFQPTVTRGMPVAAYTVTSSPLPLSNLVQCLATSAVTPRLTSQPVRVLPQPMRTSARILLPEGTLTDDVQLLLHDRLGRRIALPATRLPDGFELQRGGIAPGLYTYQVLQGGQRIAGGKLWVVD
jgi:hypothetical protein